MPLATQAKLLKILETQAFRRLSRSHGIGALHRRASVVTPTASM
jgi:hypothetical protein